MNVSAQPTTTIHIASMMLHPTAPQNTSVLTPQLAVHYIDPAATAQTNLQNSWQQGLQFYRDRLTSLGGFTVTNQTNVDIQFFIDITFWAVALPSDTPAVQLAKMTKFMNDSIHGVYANTPIVFIAPPSPYLTSAPVDQLALFCESTQACIMILPITIDPSVFICTASSPDPAAGAAMLLPPDCLARGRRAGRRRFDYTITTAPPSLQVADGWISAMRVQGMTSMVIIRCPNWDNQANAARSTASKNGIRVMADFSVLPTYNGTASDWVVHLRTIYGVNPSASQGLALFIGYSLTEGVICANILIALKLLDITPTAINYACSCQAVAPYVSKQFVSDNLVQYGYGVAPWDPTSQGPEFEAHSQPGSSFEPFETTSTQDSPEVYANALAQWRTTQSQPVLRNDVSTAQSSLAPLIIQKAAELMGVTNPTATDLKLAFSQISSASHYGNLVLDADGRFSDRPYPFNQVINGLSLLQFPTGHATPVYPQPTWQERITPTLTAFYRNPSETGILIIVGISILFAEVILVSVIMFRKHKVIVAATAEFCFVICIGATLMLCVPFLWSLNENDFTCNAKIWWIHIAFVMVLVPILLKTYRLMRFFASGNNLNIGRITTPMLRKYLIIIVGCVILYLIVWLSLAPMTATVVVADPYRPSLNYKICSTAVSSNITNGFVYTSLVAGAFILFANCYVAYKVKDVPDENFNETAHIGTLVYTISLLSFVVVLASWILDSNGSNRVIAYIVRSIGFILFGVLTLIIMLVPKIISIKRLQRIGGIGPSYLGGNGTQNSGGVGGGSAERHALSNDTAKHSAVGIRYVIQGATSKQPNNVVGMTGTTIT